MSARSTSPPPFAKELRAWWLEATNDRPDDFVLPSSTGRQANLSNLRRDLFRPTIDAANAELAKDGMVPIGVITFHSSRRTYASLGCACGDDVAYTSAQIGHTDPRFTLQATMRRERLSGPHLHRCAGYCGGNKKPPERGFAGSG